MTMTVTIPPDLAVKLTKLAELRGAAPERLAVDLLTEEVEGTGGYFLTPEEVVAKIKATPPDPASITPASGLLREHLERALGEPPIDAEAWNREWARIEADMKARDRLDDIISPQLGMLLTRVADTPDLEAALHKVLTDYLDLKATLRPFEERWGMSFTAFAQACQTGALSVDPYGYDVESDYWEWEAADTLLDHYAEIHQQWQR